MSHPLVSRSDDLQRLVSDGYEVDIRSSHLVVGHIPFLDASGTVAYGDLVSELVIAGDRTDRPDPHTVYFTGVPHGSDGSPLNDIIASIHSVEVFPGMTADSYLSTKPAIGYYADYFDKITQYAMIIAGPARAVDPKATARTHQPIVADDETTPFVYLDSASVRAGISDISPRLAAGPVGIIGLGGTGSFVLDLLAKTPVPQIHLWDPDVFLTHNAFRAPGAASLGQLRERPMKVDFFREVYSRMHRGIVAHAQAVQEDTLPDLADLSFVFICIDTGPIKRTIIDFLVAHGIGAIDVGMGVHRQGSALGGIVRTTTILADHADHIDRRLSFGDEQDDEYERNIQLADLNALNAAFAVLKWKKLMGFYRDDIRELHTTFTIAASQLSHSELTA